MALFSTPVFINLPTRDAARIRSFWSTLGARIVDEYSADYAICVELTESVYAMYLDHHHYAPFTGGRPIADTQETNATLLAVTVGTRPDVDRLCEAALAAGASEVQISPEMLEQMGEEMYVREMVDPDGHQWEFGVA